MPHVVVARGAEVSGKIAARLRLPCQFAPILFQMRAMKTKAVKQIGVLAAGGDGSGLRAIIPLKHEGLALPFLSRTLLALAALCLAGCAQYASVKARDPIFRPPVAPSAEHLSFRQRIEQASRLRKSRPLAAVGDYLTAADAAAKRLQADPDDTVARDAYNFALARVIGTLREADLAPWPQPLQIPAESGGYTLTYKRDPRPKWNPGDYVFTPADQFDVRGKYVSERKTKDGIGAPLVAMGRGKNENFREEFSVPRTFYGVTAVVRFRGKTAELAFEDPLADEQVRLGGREVPLAADFTVPLAVLLDEANPKKKEITRLLWPEKYAETARLTRLQPYDPDKTVVLVIHGLMDSPATWAPMINKLRSDPKIRQHYQFWFYSYPSGYPYPHSAAILRRELDAVQKKFPLRKPMVVIGHSMGGCISRLLITDTGEKLWDTIFGQPRGQTPMSGDSRRLFTEALVFKRRPEIGRVIFISAPLRGADMAVHWTGRIGSSLVRAPQTLLAAGADAMSLATWQTGDLKLRRIPNSIDTLAPNNRFVRAINAIPMNDRVSLNVIGGDRGEGGNNDQRKPVRSDGVVPYWSLHLPQAESERIVASDHSAHQHPDAIDEVARILKRHTAN